MPVENMKMLGALGRIDSIDEITRKMVDCGCVHIVNAMESVNNEEKKIISPYEANKDYLKLKDRIAEAMDIFGIEKQVETALDEVPDIGKISTELESVYSQAVAYKRKIDDVRGDIEKFQELKRNLENIKEVKFPLSTLKELKFFSFTIGRFNKEKYSRLKDNIENIPAIIYELSSTSQNRMIVAFTPVDREKEVEGIFRSLNYERVTIPEGVKGVPAEIIVSLETMIREKNSEMENILKDKSTVRGKYRELLKRLFTEIVTYERMQYIINESAGTDDIFYTIGWVPEEFQESLASNIEFGERSPVVFSLDASKIKAAPPTRLKNSKLFKPFEYLVTMYGLPSYDEIDPTVFFTITYCILFGGMFGDVGQGLVILIAGLYLYFGRRVKSFGGIFIGMGLSSCIFGFLYGSVFGNDKIVKPLLFNPFRNINSILIGGVAIGIVLTTIGIIFNIINSLRRGDMEEGIFGRDGLAGLIFYWGVLLTALGIYFYGNESIPFTPAVIVLVLLIIVMVFKQPLSNLVKGHRPLHHESPGDYYVENGFGILETVISMASKTISFIRVGAFAINHAGLFAAFVTISALIKNRAGSIGILILGNILIIGLEGLIVFIQGLRLEYYELFSRYYRGGGIEYTPVTLKEKKQ